MSLRNNCHKKCALTPQQILDTAYKKLASSFTKGETRASIIYAIYKSIKTQLNTLRELCQTQRAAEMKHLRQIIETIMISLMGRVTSARGLVTM